MQHKHCTCSEYDLFYYSIKFILGKERMLIKTVNIQLRNIKILLKRMQFLIIQALKVGGLYFVLIFLRKKNNAEKRNFGFNSPGITGQF